MPTAVHPKSIAQARRLRRDMTDGERRLWTELRDFRRHFGIHVRRQAPIGRFIADFAVHERKLIIEVDGEHHFLPDRLERDAVRDRWFVSQGYTVLRFNTGELCDAFDGCVEEIMRELGVIARGNLTPQPTGASHGSRPSFGPPQGGGGRSWRP